MVYDILCHNNQDGSGQELYTLDQVSYEEDGKVFNYSYILFSLNYFFIKLFFKR